MPPAFGINPPPSPATTQGAQSTQGSPSGSLANGTYLPAGVTLPSNSSVPDNIYSLIGAVPSTPFWSQTPSVQGAVDLEIINKQLGLDFLTAKSPQEFNQDQQNLGFSPMPGTFGQPAAASTAATSTAAPAATNTPATADPAQNAQLLALIKSQLGIA